jgi:hypothetical protein
LRDVKNEELLDELRNGLLRDASPIKVGGPDSYWSDARLLRYIDDGYFRFARATLCLHDFRTPEVCQLTLRSGLLADDITPILFGNIYPLHRSVISVLSVRHQDDQHDLARVTHEVATTASNTFTETFEFDIVNTTGKPTSFSTDEGIDPTAKAASQIAFYDIPNSTQIGKKVNLRVIRKPLHHITFDRLDKEPEVPEEYHLDLIEWAAWRALRNWDIDSEDRTKANDHLKRFEAAVVECRRDVLRKRRQTLHWAFGQSGYGGYVHN